MQTVKKTDMADSYKPGTLCRSLAQVLDQVGFFGALALLQIIAEDHKAPKDFIDALGNAGSKAPEEV